MPKLTNVVVSMDDVLDLSDWYAAGSLLDEDEDETVQNDEEVEAE